MSTLLLHRTTGLDMRAAAEAGTFEGYLCLHDVVDSYGTEWAPGAWSAGGLDTTERAYALLHMHDPYTPVGTFSAREDDTGLWIAGAWDDSTAGRDARARGKSGSMPALSVGFEALAVDPDKPSRFLQTRLVEGSQITARMGAVPGAGFSKTRITPLDAAAAALRAKTVRARLILTSVR